MLQIAFFLLIMVAEQEWPMVAGPYNIDECLTVQEFLVRRGYEVSACESMSLPQDDAVKLEVPYLPIPKVEKP
jgi:hypothetical protein